MIWRIKTRQITGQLFLFSLGLVWNMETLGTGYPNQVQFSIKHTNFISQIKPLSKLWTSKQWQPQFNRFLIISQPKLGNDGSNLALSCFIVGPDKIETSL